MQYTGKRNASHNESSNPAGRAMSYGYGSASSKTRGMSLGIDDEFPSVADLLASESEAFTTDVTGENNQNDKLSVKNNNNASESVTGRHSGIYDDDDMLLFRDYDELLRIADFNVDDKHDSAPKPSSTTGSLGSMYRNDEWETTNAPKRVRSTRSRARRSSDLPAPSWLDDDDKLLREIDSIIADDERISDSVVNDSTRAIAVGIVDGTSPIYDTDTGNAVTSTSNTYRNNGNGTTRYQPKRNASPVRQVELDAELPDPRVETISDVGGTRGVDSEYIDMLEEYNDLDDQLFGNDVIDAEDVFSAVDNDNMEKTRVIASRSISGSITSDNTADGGSSLNALRESRGERASRNKRGDTEHGEWLDARRDAIASIYVPSDIKTPGVQHVASQESSDAEPEPDLTGGWDAVRTGELWDNWYAAVNAQAERIERENAHALESVTPESAGGVLPVIDDKKRNKSGTKRTVLLVTAIILMIGGSFYALRASGLLDGIIGSILG